MIPVSAGQSDCPAPGAFRARRIAPPLAFTAVVVAVAAISSPAINAGNTAEVPADIKTDLDGRPRVTGVAVDIGAYETGAIGVPALSEAGLGALILLVSLAGWTALRRAG